MITSFTQNPKAVVAAEGSAGINETGAYVVTIKQCETEEKPSGAQMVNFWLVADDGRESWTSLCIVTKDGKESWGMGLLQSLMVVTGVQNAQAHAARVRLRNGDIKENGFRIREVEGKKAGVVLQRENYTYVDSRTGEEKETYRMNPLRFFHPNTRQTASEVLANADAVKLEGLLKTLKDKNPKQAAQPQAPQPPAQPAPMEFLDEDIPI